MNDVETTRDMQTLPSALGHPGAIEQRLATKRAAFFLDYDGKLTPIVDDPDKAVLSKRMRAVMEDLAQRSTVAVISGRDVEDVRRHVGIESIYYAGSHGLDIIGPGVWHKEFGQATALLPVLDQAEVELRNSLSSIPGVRVERKRFAIAIHYRQAADRDVPAVQKVVEGVKAAHKDLYMTGGKKVFELRPQIGWDKGKAVLWLMGAADLKVSDALPIYIGDDVTDEDAFRALKDCGIGIVVRDGSRPTLADFALQSPAEVQLFLQAFLVEPEKRV